HLFNILYIIYTKRVIIIKSEEDKMQNILIITIMITQLFIVLGLFLLKSNITSQTKRNLEGVDQKNNHMLDRLDIRINDILERNANFERLTSKNLNEFKQSLSQSLSEHFMLQQKTIETRLDKIDLKVNESLHEGF